MAQNISGLFNYDSPEAIQTNYLNTLAARRPRGGGDLYSQLANAGGNIGGLLGYTLGGLAGYKPAGMQKAETMDQIMAEAAKGANPLAQAIKAYELFSANGMGREAQVAMERVDELKKAQEAQGFNQMMASGPQLQTPQDYINASKAAFAAGDGQAGIAMRNQAMALVKEQKAEEQRLKGIESRTGAVQRLSPGIDPELAAGIASDTTLFGEFAKEQFKVKDTKNNVAFKTVDGNVEAVVTDTAGNIVSRKVLGAAPSTAPRVEVKIDQRGLDEYAKLVGAEVAKKDVGIVTLAETAAESMPKIQDTLDVLRLTKNGPITGIGAEILLNFERVKAKFLKDKGSIEKVKNTELLDAFLGSEVFPMITALGIGARGLDTPAEREFLRGVFTGTIAMSNATLIEMTEIRERIAQRAVDKYNKKLSEGYFKNYEKAQGRELAPLTFGSATTSNWD
jgi:hypothetical protein